MAKIQRNTPALPKQEPNTARSIIIETPMIPVNLVKRMKSARRSLFGPFNSKKSTESETSSREDQSEKLELRTEIRNVSPKSPDLPPSPFEEEKLENSVKFVYRYPTTLVNFTPDD